MEDQFGGLPDVVRHWKRCASIQKQFQNLIVVPVSGQDQRRDIGSEGGVFVIQRLPALMIDKLISLLVKYFRWFIFKNPIHSLHKVSLLCDVSLPIREATRQLQRNPR